MKTAAFHHPDISLPVIRRRATEAALDAMLEVGAFLATKGRSALVRSCYPSDTAYRSAMWRLRKQGLVARRRERGKTPVLALTEKGQSSLPEVCRRSSPWPRKWGGLWYVLLYDVPESERAYRVALRKFLKRLRMGCLQKSVWVSHRDIRPEYDDLVQAGAVDDYSFLLESRTVLGRGPQAVIRAAWDMDGLQNVQRWYCETCEENLENLRGGALAKDELLALARDERMAYLHAMSADPLLPRNLWPGGYAGEQAWKLHRRMVSEITRRL